MSQRNRQTAEIFRQLPVKCEIIAEKVKIGHPSVSALLVVAAIHGNSHLGGPPELPSRSASRGSEAEASALPEDAV